MTKKSRRAFAGAALSACALLALGACGTTNENSGGGGNASGYPAECKGPEGEFTIGMSQANVAEPYRERMDDDIRAAAAKIPQFKGKVSFADAAQDNNKQVQQVQAFITQQVDLLIISPNESTPLTSIVEQAYNKGIPVIVLDRKIDSDAYTTFIGADNVEIGKLAGEYIAKNLLPNGGKLLEIKGLSGSTPAQERHDGFKQGIEGKNITVAGDADGEWLRDKGQQQAEALLKAHPDVNVIYSHNDPMAEGAQIAAKNAGRDDLKVTGIDGLPIPSGGIKAVEDGRLQATFVYPTGGEEAVAAAKKILVDCKKNLPKKQKLPTKLITKDNAAEVYAEENKGR